MRNKTIDIIPKLHLPVAEKKIISTLSSMFLVKLQSDSGYLRLNSLNTTTKLQSFLSCRCRDLVSFIVCFPMWLTVHCISSQCRSSYVGCVVHEALVKRDHRKNIQATHSCFVWSSWVPFEKTYSRVLKRAAIYVEGWYKQCQFFV